MHGSRVGAIGSKNFAGEEFSSSPTSFRTTPPKATSPRKHKRYKAVDPSSAEGPKTNSNAEEGSSGLSSLTRKVSGTLTLLGKKKNSSGSLIPESTSLSNESEPKKVSLIGMPPSSTDDHQPMLMPAMVSTQNVIATISATSNPNFFTKAKAEERKTKSFSRKNAIKHTERLLKAPEETISEETPLQTISEEMPQQTAAESLERSEQKNCERTPPRSCKSPAQKQLLLLDLHKVNTSRDRSIPTRVLQNSGGRSAHSPTGSGNSGLGSSSLHASPKSQFLTSNSRGSTPRNSPKGASSTEYHMSSNDRRKSAESARTILCQNMPDRHQELDRMFESELQSTESELQSTLPLLFFQERDCRLKSSSDTSENSQSKKLTDSKIVEQLLKAMEPTRCISAQDIQEKVKDFCYREIEQLLVHEKIGERSLEQTEAKRAQELVSIIRKSGILFIDIMPRLVLLHSEINKISNRSKFCQELLRVVFGLLKVNFFSEDKVKYGISQGIKVRKFLQNFDVIYRLPPEFVKIQKIVVAALGVNSGEILKYLRHWDYTPKADLFETELIAGGKIRLCAEVTSICQQAVHWIKQEERLSLIEHCCHIEHLFRPTETSNRAASKNPRWMIVNTEKDLAEELVCSTSYRINSIKAISRTYVNHDTNIRINGIHLEIGQLQQAPSELGPAKMSPRYPRATSMTSDEKDSLRSSGKSKSPYLFSPRSVLPVGAIPGRWSSDELSNKVESKSGLNSTESNPRSQRRYKGYDENEVKDILYWTHYFAMIEMAASGKKVTAAYNVSSAMEQVALFRALQKDPKALLIPDSDTPLIASSLLYKKLPVLAILELSTIDSWLVCEKYKHLLFPGFYPEIYPDLETPFCINYVKGSTLRDFKIYSWDYYKVSQIKTFAVYLNEETNKVSENALATITFSWTNEPAWLDKKGNLISCSPSGVSLRTSDPEMDKPAGGLELVTTTTTTTTTATTTTTTVTATTTTTTTTGADEPLKGWKAVLKVESCNIIKKNYLDAIHKILLENYLEEGKVYFHGLHFYTQVAAAHGSRRPKGTKM